MLILAAGTKAVAGADTYLVQRSLRTRSSATAYLTRTPTVAGNNTTYTISAWVKRGTLGVEQVIFFGGLYNVSNGYKQTLFEFKADDTFTYREGQVNVSETVYEVLTTQVFRDVGAWYHFVMAVDHTQATAANRYKLYVNGVQVTTFTTANYPAQNYGSQINTTQLHTWACHNGGVSRTRYFDGYLAEAYLIDGQALTPTSFGATNADTGVWRAKAYTGTYGTNGHYLQFSDNSALTTASNVGLGKDFSGNALYYVTNGISITAGSTYDSMTDVSTNTSATAGNYCTLNPLNTARTLSNGNLTYATAASGITKGTIGVSSGKWYWEFTAGATGCLVGLCDITLIPTTSYIGSALNSWGYDSSGQKYNNGTGSAYGATFTTGDVIGIALDASAGTITFYKNNVSQGTAFTGLTGYTFTPANGNNGVTDTGSFNFGQQGFKYTPPTGYVALNTYNLPDSTILKANKYMDATTYSGTGANQAITNAGSFKPDFLWLKCRSTAATDHVILDTTRGTSLRLASNTTQADTTQTTNIVSFDTGGFTASTGGDANGSSRTYVAWQWNANNGSTSSNTNGSITSTVQANTSAGFSIVTYTGNGTNATIGHGLGVAPSMMIFKTRSVVDQWTVYHKSLGATQYLYLSSTNAANTSSAPFNNTAPTSTVFSVSSTATWLNGNGVTYVAYCFAEIVGFSKFGSYTGNGSADGTFVYLGFRPKFILFKGSSFVTEWQMIDTSRSTYNIQGASLQAQSNVVESTTQYIDILSNGFKFRTALMNDSGQTFIYAAFAENPFKYSNAR
jgi:hypothetical protein